MTKRHLLTILLTILGMPLFSQETKPNFGISFTGFIRSDFFYDSRQVVTFREGNFLMYPENIAKDANGTDLNAKPSLNFLAICTRLKANVTAPDALGAKISGAIEGEFFGHTEGDINGFRLRLAFVKMSWPKTELIMGQYWHPMFITDAAIIPISFNTGAPFQPITRYPQIRLTHDISSFRIMGMAYTQRDHSSFGPNYADPSKPIASGIYLRNAAIPDLHLQIQYRPSGKQFIAGAGVDFKTLMPELYTTGQGGKKYQTKTTLSSWAYFAFAKAIFKPLTIRAGAYMAENAADMVFIGGYACSNITDTLTNARSWTNIRTSSAWIDFSNNNPTYKVGLLLGYTKNLGSKDQINTNLYCSRGKDIDHVLRASPRFVYVKNKLEVSFELEYTVAAYGDTDMHGRVVNLHEVSNLRPLLVTALNF
jgi:hypothetical protein